MSFAAQRPSVLMRAYRLLNRPYYWYRPAQLALRVRHTVRGERELRLERAAWGSQLYCWPDPLGRAVARTGVYDLIVSETLARLAERGECVIDAGANVGLMSNLLAHAVGPTGHVVSYEPHPVVFEVLQRNLGRWRSAEGIDVIEARQAAVSSVPGTVTLSVDPETFAHNRGTASLEHADRTHSTEVRAVCLDGEFSRAVGVLKLDVEMHELSALRGAESLLARKLIRDVVFEEHAPPPTAVTSLLESHGYTVMSVRQGLTGPIVAAPAEARNRKLWDPPALLATREPARARQLLGRRGWVCLRRSSSFAPAD